MGVGYSRRAVTATTPDLDAEREIDLARWRRAVVRLWWLPVAGLIVGAIGGGIYSLRGSSEYKAAALISLGQPVSPGGSLVNGFYTNPRAIALITSSASAQSDAEEQAGLSNGALRGKVSVAQVGAATGSGATRATPLISLTVTGANAAKTQLAANALAAVVVKRTTAPYVGTKIETYHVILRTTRTQLASISDRIAAADKAISQANLDPLNKLVLVTQLDSALQRQGNLLNQLSSTQTQLAFSQNVESAKVISEAEAVKSSAHSRKSAILIGALIGLIVGAVVAVAGDGRIGRRPRPA
jgi:uncharacterized protein involved in exopolysaccharide biosynthesis